MERKYEFTGETKTFCGITLHRIRALRSFSGVSAGDIGGWIEKEENLSHDGKAWVSGNAQVYGNAEVSGNARVSVDADVSNDGNVLWISGIGSRNGTTTFFACADKSIYVTCGCFFGSIDDFASAVKKTHGDNVHAKVYGLAIEIAKARILPAIAEKEV